MQRARERGVHALGTAHTKGRIAHRLVAQLVQRRHSGPALGALAAVGGQEAQLARINMRAPAGCVARAHGVAAQDGLHVVGIALERHGCELDAGTLRKLFHGQVRAGAVAGVAVGELLRVGLGVGHQVGNGLDGRIHRHHKAEGVAGEAGDPGEILQRVELHLLHVRDTEHAVRQLAQRVAVRLGVDQLIGAEGTARAGFVVHDDLHAQGLGGALRDRADHRVGAAARRPGADVADGLVGKGLRKGEPGQSDAGCGTGQDELAAVESHAVSPLINQLLRPSP